jgi:hypothetical protein
VDPVERCWEVWCADRRAVDFRHRTSEICASEYGIRNGSESPPRSGVRIRLWRIVTKSLAARLYTV